MDREFLMARYQDLQQYVGWSEDDARRIARVAPLLEPFFPRFVDDFYQEIERHPNAHRVITGGNAQIDRLKLTLREWLKELLSGQYDIHFVEHRQQVGERHVEIGLDQAYANAAVSRLRRNLHEALIQLGESQQLDPVEVHAVARSLNMLLDLDLAIIDDTYRAEAVSRLRQLEDLKHAAERRDNQEKLHKEREFAQSIIETAQAIVLVLDREGRIVQFNPFLEELGGYTLDEVRQKDWFETFLPERDREKIKQIFQRALEGEPVRGHINPIITRNGRERSIAWWATTLKGSEGTTVGVLSIGNDVTELQEAQRRALQAERLAAIGKAMAGLTHESRNALQRSQVGLEMLARRLDGRQELLELTQRIQRAQDDLHQLYEEVCEYAAPIRLKPQPCDLTSVLLDVWGELKFKRDGRDVSLRQHTGVFELEAFVDHFAIKQVFRNILENALAACADPVHLDVHFSQTNLPSGPGLRIAFRDNGPGLTEEARERIFEEFYTTKTQGTGLGMAICKRIVEAHGGIIDVGPGPGAEILVTLPDSLPDGTLA